MTETILYDYWLASTEGIGLKTVLALSQAGYTSKSIYELSDLQIDKLASEKLLTAQIAHTLKERRTLDLQKEYDNLLQKEINVLFPWDCAYPTRLKRIPDPPLTLYVHGTLPPQDTLSVAIVGARCCSSYGSYVAKELGSTLAAEGISVVSGMASGIDGISQQSALDAGGNVFAVLGCGVDVCYPPRNRPLYDALWSAPNCGIMSEYLPGTKSKASLFPPRNRIISGLSDVVVVIEAKLKSGTLITVDMALEQGKEVYALPGRITDRLSDGCNRLLRDGARPLLSPKLFLSELKEDILPLVKQRASAETASPDMRSASVFPPPHMSKRSVYHDYNELAQKQSVIPASFSETQSIIYQSLEQTPITMEALCARTGIFDLSVLLFELTTMQLQGYVSQSGNLVCRTQ